MSLSDFAALLETEADCSKQPTVEAVLTPPAVRHPLPSPDRSWTLTVVAVAAQEGFPRDVFKKKRTLALNIGRLIASLALGKDLDFLRVRNQYDPDHAREVEGWDTVGMSPRFVDSSGPWPQLSAWVMGGLGGQPCLLGGIIKAVLSWIAQGSRVSTTDGHTSYTHLQTAKDVEVPQPHRFTAVSRLPCS